ncbi:MAG TPA: sn-glycerol-3-phosphate transporter [Burkholderiales bacterium]|nr:sn-glycerol-3-phosphate transporter [Burkholderiales bacterium]
MLNRFVGLLLLLVAGSATAEDTGAPDGRLTLVFGPYVFHYNNDSSHNDLPWLTGLEWGPKDWWVDVGAVYFRNSFYQDSVYAYVGKRWFWKKKDDGVYVKLTGGPLWGYRGEFEDKVPFNHNGLGWAIIPGLGYQYKAVDAQLVFLGGAALMVTFGYDFWK